MRVNASTRLVGSRTVLVPYKRHHVDKYHGWMQSKELQELTASEPLSMDEELAMQQSWLEDDDKCTFIVLKNGDGVPDADRAAEIAAMAGDVNLFFNNPDEKTSAEIEVMIAEPSARRLGLGREALLMIVQYAATALGVERITAKIGFDNVPSLALFASLGFSKVSESEVFQEVTLEATVLQLQKFFPDNIQTTTYAFD